MGLLLYTRWVYGATPKMSFNGIGTTLEIKNKKEERSHEMERGDDDTMTKTDKN